MLALPEPGRNPSEAADELFELKTLHLGRSTYPNGARTRSAAVERRAAAIPSEAAAKARQLDRRFCGTAAGELGPVERRLNTYGPVRGLVFGHWCEASQHVEALLSGCAHSGAQRLWAQMRAIDPHDALGVLAWLLRRRWGMAAWRSAARLLLDRLEYVGKGSAPAQARRAHAAERAAATRRQAHWLFRSRRG